MNTIVEVLYQAQTDIAIPINRAEAIETEKEPQPPELPVEPIHALQLLFLPFLLIYLFMSFIIAIVTQDFYLLGISIVGSMIPIIGLLIEKKSKSNQKKCRKIAIYILIMEFGLYTTWRISCSVMFGGPIWLFL